MKTELLQAITEINRSWVKASKGDYKGALSDAGNATAFLSQYRDWLKVWRNEQPFMGPGKTN